MTSGGKVRIYELSRDLGLDNRDVLEAAEKLSIAVRSHSSSISDDEANRIRAELKTRKGPSSPARPAEASPAGQILTVKKAAQAPATPVPPAPAAAAPAKPQPAGPPPRPAAPRPAAAAPASQIGRAHV